MKRLLIGAILSAILLFMGCAGNASAPAVTSPQLVFGLNGSGDSRAGLSTVDTKAFHISKGEWYIETTCDSLNSANPIFFAASVFPKDKPVDNYSYVAIASQSTPGKAVNYIHVAGDFYLSIAAMNVKNWSVNVYQ